jgi:hypothetical protein
MDLLRRIEEDIDNMEKETKRKFPTIALAAGQAKLGLQRLKQSYVAEVMNKSKSEDSAAPSLAQFRSSDVCSPYVIACNTTNLPAKLVLSALSGIQMLLDFGVVPPENAPNIIMALRGAATVNQASLGSALSEVQMKVLQLELQLLNFLATDPEALPNLTEGTTNSFLSLALELINESMGSSTSVTSTAFVTLKQTINVLMDAVSEAQAADKLQDNDVFTSVNLLLIDLSHVLRGKSPAWLHGVYISPASSLDLLSNMVMGWTPLFKRMPELGYILKSAIIPGLVSQLKNLQEDYIAHAKATTSSASWGTSSASDTLTVKALKLARYVALEFLEPEFASEVENVTALMLHALRAEPGIEARLEVSIDEKGQMKGQEAAMPTTATATLVGNVAAGVGIAGSLFQKLNPLSQAPSTPEHIFFLEVADSSNAFSSDPSFVPCYPSLLCLEAMLAFFLQPHLVRKLSQTEEGLKTFTAVSISTMEMLSLLLKEGLTVEGNEAEMTAAHHSSPLVKAVEQFVVGSGEVGGTRQIQDLAIGCQFVTPGEILAFSLCLVQIIVRLLVECALLCYSITHDAADQQQSTAGGQNLLFISSSYLNSMPLAFDAGRVPDVSEMLKTVFERTFDGVQDVCLMLLAHGGDEVILKRGLGLVSELAIATGLLGQQRACDLAVSTLCKCAVPRWHGDKAPLSTSPVSPRSRPRSPAVDMKSDFSDPNVMQWRHLQSVVRLMQVVHILADSIMEWETILDTFEQLSVAVTAARNSDVSHDISSSDLELIGTCLERFKTYSAFFSDEQLFRTMTSFVAISLNGLGTVASGQGEVALRRTSSPRTTRLGGDDEAGRMSYSLEAILDIVKHNAYRVSVVWQLVTSHLKMIASLKNWKSRRMAVVGTQDITMATLSFMNSGGLGPTFDYIKDVGVAGAPKTPSSSIFLNDDRLFNHVLPSLKTIFVGRIQHRDMLQVQLGRGNERPQLTQSDLLACLKTLSAVHVDDVKVDVIQGLFNMLQGGGEAIKGGWPAVVDLIAAVPISMCPTHSEEWSFSSGLSADSISPAAHEPWPRETLAVAFSSMKLVVDEFLDLLEVSIFKDIIVCLSVFGAQDTDVNVSLTAVEMLWKVVDFVMGMETDQLESAQKIEILDLTMMRLLSLSQDQRPEIRNCATNTLFTSMVANTALFSSDHWKRAFYQVIFKLFSLARAKSCDAMRSNMEAMAPELKRGVKMTVHHSRDTAHKQWSETRVLALRGLARIIRACTKVLICEQWFRDAWGDVLALCVADVRASEDEGEVALAGLDVIFAMLKMVSTHTYINSKARGAKGMRVVDGAVVTTAESGETEEGGELEEGDSSVLMAREELWGLAWSAIGDATCVPNYGSSVSLHIVTNLNDLYTGGMESEFKNSENIRRLLEFVVTVARPRGCDVEAEHAAGPGVRAPRSNRVSNMQLQHSVADLIRHVEPASQTGFSVLASALAEISFSSCPSDARFDADVGDIVVLGAIPEKLRGDAARYLRGLFLSSVAGDAQRQATMALLDLSEDDCKNVKVSFPVSMVPKYVPIVVGHFVSWQCAGLLSKRRRSGDGAVKCDVDNSTEGTSADDEDKPSGWFSFSYSDNQSPVKGGGGKRGAVQQEASPSNNDADMELMTVRSFELVPHVVGKLQISAEDESADKDWRFLALPVSSEELLLITSTMTIFLEQGSQDSKKRLPEGLARRVLISLASVISPWRRSELSSNVPDTQDLKQFAVLTQSVLKLFGAAILEGRLSRALSNTYVRIVVVLVRLLLRVVCLCDKHHDEDDHSEDERGYFKSQLIACCGTLRAALVDDYPSHSAVVGGMVEIGRDLLSVATAEDPVSDDIIAICEDHCRMLLGIKCDMSKLSKGIDSTKFELDPAILMDAFAILLLEPSEPEAAVPSHANNDQMDSGDDRAHLLLLLPLVLESCNSKRAEVRKLGMFLMTHIDLLSFLHSFNSMCGRVCQLGKENKELKEHVERLQASASLSY